MISGTRYLILFLLVVVQFGENQCWRSSRPSSPSRRPTPSPRRPFPTHAPTYRPFPTHAPTHRPFPTHAPTYRPFPTHAPTHRPFPTHAPTHRPFPTHAPTYKPFPTHAPTYKPFPTHSPTYKPFPTHAPTYRPVPTHSPTYRPYPTHAPTYRPATSKYPTQRYPTGPHQSYPGYTNAGVITARHNQPVYSVPVHVPGTNKVKIYNINNYHTPGYYAPPSYPVYHYSYRDTGSSALGFYLGYRLGSISNPTFYHHDHVFYDGYSPRYDHYTVHHYYHNNGNIPAQQTVNTKVIIQCGDSSQICPANTTSLCTANGQIMCVVIASNTVPCENNPSLRCVKSTIPCQNNDTPECKGVPKGQTTTINIPCISNTTIQGNITTVNNTIISKDPVTTTPATIETTTLNGTFPSLGARAKREVVPPPQFCVTVLAEPSKRAPTEGEEVFNQISSVFDKFFSKAFGMDKPVNSPQKQLSPKDDNYIPQFGD